MSGVDDTWRIDVDLLVEGPEAENAAKYWVYSTDTRGRIVWSNKTSELFGTTNASKAASCAAEFVTATYVGPACVGCGAVVEGVVVTSRGSVSTKRSSQATVLCEACEERKISAARNHQDRVQEWMATLERSIPANLERLGDILLLDSLTQSDPFKDRRLKGSALYRAGFSANDIARLFTLGIIIPAAVSQPAYVMFTDEGTSYHPFEMDWRPAGEGVLGDRFELIEKLAAQEIHSSRERFSGELETVARDLVVGEAERYLMFQLSDRRIDEPTEAQLKRFRDSVVDAWTDFSLGQFYYAIWPACAKAADNRARHPYMGRDAVTGSAVNAVVKNLNEFNSRQQTPPIYNQPNKIPLSSMITSVFRVMLDLDPMASCATDVAAALGLPANLPQASEDLLEDIRRLHSTCLESMPEEHAFTAALASLTLLAQYHDHKTIDVARAAFAAERMASHFTIPDGD